MDKATENLLQASKGGLFCLHSILMLSIELNPKAKASIAEYAARLEIAIDQFELVQK